MSVPFDETALSSDVIGVRNTRINIISEIIFKVLMYTLGKYFSFKVFKFLYNISTINVMHMDIASSIIIIIVFNFKIW